MESFEVLLGCEKSETAYHDFREEVRYNGEKWLSPEVRPEVVEHRAVCRLCELITEPDVINLQKAKQNLEWARRSQALGMTAEDYKQF